MKILQLIDSLETGGAERMCVNIANTLNAKGIANALVITRAPFTLQPKLHSNTTVYTGDKKHRWDIVSFLKIYRFMKSVKPDYLHAHSTTLLWACALKILNPSVKLIWHDHYGNRKNAGDNSIHKVLSICIDAIISVNNDMTAWHKQHMFVSKNNITYLANFPILDRTPSMPRNPNTILINANLLPVKDHMTLLKALHLINLQHIPFKLLMIGKEVDSSYTQSLKDYIQEHQLSENIELLGQVTSIEPLLNIAAIGVISSVSEGLPVSLLEYGLAELAVVSTNVGQCAEVLGNGRFGWIIAPGDSKNLAQIITMLLLNPDKAREKAQLFRQHILAEYSSERFLDNYLSLLNKI